MKKGPPYAIISKKLRLSGKARSTPAHPVGQILRGQEDPDPSGRTSDLSDIKKIAVETGTVLDIAAQGLVPDAEIV